MDIGLVASVNRIDELTDAIIKSAYEKGVEVCVFAFPDIDYETKTVKAKKWDGTQYVDIVTPIPPIVDSRQPLGTHSKAMRFYGPQVEWLQAHTRVLGTGGLAKKALSECLFASKYGTHGIMTFGVETYEQVVTSVAIMQDCIIKPSGGRQGRGVLSAKMDGASVLINDGERIQPLTEAYWAQYIQKLTDEDLKMPIIQPRLNFKFEGKAMDFRLLTAKGRSGTWEIIKIYARVGSNEVTSNVSRGGYRDNLTVVLQKLCPEQAERLEKELYELALGVPEVIEQNNSSVANYFGIDVGIDCDTMQTYVVEANTFPQPGVSAKEIADKKTDYYLYLLEQAKK